jgi:transposase
MQMDSLEEAVRRRLLLLALVEQGQSIRAAARKAGLSRGVYEQAKRTFARGGETLLRERLERRLSLKQWTIPAIDEAIDELLESHPQWGVWDVVAELRRRHGCAPIRRLRERWAARGLHDRRRDNRLPPGARQVPRSTPTLTLPNPTTVEGHVLRRVRAVELVGDGMSIGAACRITGLTRTRYMSAQRILRDRGPAGLWQLVVRTEGKMLAKPVLAELCGVHPTWGQHRLRRALREHGFPLGRQQVRALLIELGRCGTCRPKGARAA